MMVRTQIQLPDEMYKNLKRLARSHEMTLAELLRRGCEYILSVYKPADDRTATWSLPKPRTLGLKPGIAAEDMRLIANEMPLTGSSSSKGK